jgi:hypothetical protein
VRPPGSCDERERAQARAELLRELHREHAAHRPADDCDPRHVERAHEVLEVARESGNRVAGARMRRFAVAAHVDRDHRVPVAERDHLPLPHRPVERPAVDEEHGGTATRSIVAQRDARVGEKRHARS